ncbi:MAG: EAL domain-containing protein [Giesbergeria sp.]|uniref:sensor domain-containing protein n=1 Tax=Giesbergeria sp. TaxID=2818473 RepID=UPI0026077008|nr:EAL domain-containing protein [Giesbergeria sp.]MDD2610851.1 EAL domain-containing protein [Giesbergeria sp.]
MNKSRESGGKRALRGLLLYLVVGAVWVLGINHFLARMTTDAAEGANYHLWADGLYLLVTGGVAWWLLQRSDKARVRAFRRTALLLRHAPAGIVRADSNGHILWANERMCELTGMSLEQLCQHQFRAVVQPPDSNWSERQRERLLAGEIDHYRGERQCRRPDGSIVPVVCTVTLVPRAAGEPAHLICVVQDISDSHAARAALERSQAGLDLALEGSGSGMWDWDLRTRQGSVSPSLERLLRYSGQNFVGDFCLRHKMQRSECKRVLAAAHLAIATGDPFHQTLRLRCFDGQERWFMARGQRHLDATGQPDRFSGILTDLSHSYAAQERQRLAATVVDNTLEGVVVTDAANRILSVNAAFTRVLGYTEDELLGKTPSQFKSGRHDETFYQAMWATMHRTGHWQGEIWNRRKNGEIFPEHMSLSAVRDPAGTITHYVCIFSDISEAKAQQERLEYLAHRDALTGLSNRVWFGQQLEGAVAQAKIRGEHLAVLLINLDRFKDVNDSYGHAVGDEVLQHLAKQVGDALRPGDLLGRLAGDELAVVARNLHDAQADASSVARHLLTAVSQPWYSPQGLEVVVGASVGICLFPTHADNAKLLLQGAHAAVYGAKARGRGAFCFFAEEMTLAARERLELESRLRQALVQGQLQLHYQAQADIMTGRIIGAEALLRWTDPHEGPISPARFIPVAESSGLIGPLGEWVLRQVCQQGQRWLEAGLPAITLAINVSPRQFQLTDLVASARSALAETGFPASHLELEITESALAERFEEVLKVLEDLQGLGLHLAVDDFGTGYSSLAHLKRFPIDVLKIDQSFIRDIPHHSDDMAISAAIIAMGHSMALKVLAEGVETAEQLAFLTERGCDSYQGYLLSRPLPAADFARLLAQQAQTTTASADIAAVG